MIRKSILVLCMITTLAVIFFGQRAWVKNQELANLQTPSIVTSSDEESETDGSDKQPDEGASIDPETLENLIQNQPNVTKVIWENAKITNDPVDITFVATSSGLSNEENWTTILQQAMTDSYEGLTLSFTTLEHEGTSSQWIDQLSADEELLSGQDIIIYELPTLSDNGEIETTDQVANAEEFISIVSERSPEASLFAQPSQPLFEATIYPNQVDAVRLAFETNELTYLDHWTEWPALDDPELENYLTEDNDANELGSQTWGDYLTRYFTGN